MSILLNAETRVVVQGVTGTGGQYHTRLMRAYGTRIVAGVAPGRGGRRVDDVPVFDTLSQAVEATGAEFAACFVPGPAVLDSLLEAADAGIHTVVVMAEFVPLHDLILARQVLDAAGCRLIGPNTNGLVSPGQAKVGFFPTELARPGPVGIASRSGTLSYGTSVELLRAGIGQSSVVGIGGGKLRGVGFAECLELFDADPATRVMVLLGEIGGLEEERAAEYIRTRGCKPVVALVVGRCAPPDTPMGHAGALLSGAAAGVEAKQAVLRAAGVRVARTLGEVPSLVVATLQET